MADFEGSIKENSDEDDNSTGTTAMADAKKQRAATTKVVCDLLQQYRLGVRLGEGSFGKVYRMYDYTTNEAVAVKEIKMDGMEEIEKQDLHNEIEILKELRGCPGVVQLVKVFSSPLITYLVLEECKGGDLNDRHRKKKNECYDEYTARQLFRSLLGTMAQLHKNNIVHLDIKPANLLLVSPKDDVTVKVADFGFSQSLREADNKIFDRVGSPSHNAPEIWRCSEDGYSGQKADMWAVGVVLNQLLTGKVPFRSENAICRHQRFYFDENPKFNAITDEAKTLVQGLLHPVPDQRFSAEDALQCEWMTMTDEELAKAIKMSEGRKVVKVKRWDDFLDAWV